MRLGKSFLVHFLSGSPKYRSKSTRLDSGLGIELCAELLLVGWKLKVSVETN